MAAGWLGVPGVIFTREKGTFTVPGTSLEADSSQNEPEPRLIDGLTASRGEAESPCVTLSGEAEYYRGGPSPGWTEALRNH